MMITKNNSESLKTMTGELNPLYAFVFNTFIDLPKILAFSCCCRIQLKLSPGSAEEGMFGALRVGRELG